MNSASYTYSEIASIMGPGLTDLSKGFLVCVCMCFFSEGFIIGGSLAFQNGSMKTVTENTNCP